MKNKIFIYLSVSLFLISGFVKAQNPSKEKDFAIAVNKLLDALNNGNEEEINQLIHPEYGVAVIYKIGVPNVVANVKQIDFVSPVVYYVPYEGVKCNKRNIKYESLPEFLDNKERWTKTEGIYCDTTIINHLHSESIRFLIDYEDCTYLEEEYEKIVDLENLTRRVIIRSENDTESTIVHLSYIDGKWYFSLYDKVTEDLSA